VIIIEQFSAPRPFGRLLVFAFFICGFVSASAQGTLNFANNTGTRLFDYFAYFPPANSTAYKAGLYWGPQGTPEASLVLLPASSNGVTTTWLLSGLFIGGTASFPVPGGTVISVQVRVWTATYADYAAAVASLPGDPSVAIGKGIIQTVALGGGGDPPSAPQDLAAPSGGGTPFQPFLVAGPLAPEPSSIALALLGIGAIVLFRRRR
jgi:hypothetical protein